MNKLVFSGLLLLAAIPVSAANEVENPMAVSDTSRVVDLDEVVVVSQPKDIYRLRQQPLSSSVFSTQELQQLNIRELRDLSVFVPSFAMPAYGSRYTSAMYLRGLGSRMTNTAVGVYYDNIPLMSPASFNSHFYMTDRVDVLRGPQGTLYGANTEAGIVRVYSKNPMSYQGTDVLLGFSSDLGRQVEAATYQRPCDKFAFGLAGFYKGQDGFFRNQNLDEKNDRGYEAGGKLRLLWQPTERLSFDLTSDYQFSNQNAFPYGVYDTEKEWADLPSTTVMPYYKRNMVNSGLTIGYQFNRFMLTSTTSFQHLYDRLMQDVDYLPVDKVVMSQHQKMNALTEELVLRSKGNSIWQHATGLYGARQAMRTTADVTFGEGVTGPMAQGILNAMRQGMLNGMKASMLQNFLAQGMPQAAAEAAAQRAAEAAVNAAGLHMQATIDPVASFFKLPVTNLAAYHESNLTLADRLTLTLGLRYDYSKYEIDYRSSASASVTGGTARAISTGTSRSVIENHLSNTSSQLLPKFGITYKLGDQGSNIYATASKGYMNGGYNINLFGDIMQADVQRQTVSDGVVDIPHTDADYEAIANTITYKPEESWNFELGTRLNLLDNKLHADIATFYTMLHNQQLTVMAPGNGYGRMTVNADKSSTCGLEAALRGVAFDNHLSWAATYSFTRATFRKFTNEEQDANGQVVTVDYKDNKLPNVPAHMFSAMADYRVDFRSDAVLRSLTFGANVTGNGKTYWDSANTASQGFYALLGAHLLADMGAVSVNFWGRNLTDTHYCPFAVYSESTGGFIGQRGNPIQMGVDVRMHF